MKLITFDTETTGVDTENDRIITAFMRAKDGDKVVFERNWVIDPGVEVPVEAAEVHGMSTEWVRENGRKDVAEAISEIVANLVDYGRWGFIVAGYNSSFDLAILEAEAKRSRENVVGIAFVKPQTRFIDPIIFSRRFDKYRKGGHKLVDIARAHGFNVEEEKAHAADYDVEMTEFLVPKMLNLAWKKMPKERAGLTPDEFVDKLQGWQAEWKSEWASGLTQYFEKVGKLEEDGSKIVVSGAFPW